MCNTHHLMKRSLKSMQDGQADESLGKSHRDAALLFHQWSIGCECNVLLDKSQW